MRKHFIDGARQFKNQGTIYLTSLNGQFNQPGLPLIVTLQHPSHLVFRAAVDKALCSQTICLISAQFFCFLPLIYCSDMIYKMLIDYSFYYFEN